MRLDAADIRPRSLFDRSSASPLQLGMGAAVVFGVHIGLPLLGMMIVGLLTLAGIATGAAPPEPPPPLENVIQAHFLQRGEIIDPRTLPNRRVPILRTDTAQPMPSPHAPTERPERQERQRDSVADAIQRLSDEAQIFAEREERRIQEGDPDGIEGGEREASEGDLYAGRLSSFFQRGWTVPTTIPRDQVEQMNATALVEISPELRILSFRIQRSSGNPDFDLSVTAQLQRLVDGQAVIPPPPEDVADQYLGQTRPFRFNGRNAR